MACSWRRAGGVYGQQVPIGDGVPQCDVILPMFFNLVVDSILCLTDRIKPELQERVQKVFYADDGLTGGDDADKVQEVQDVVDDLFERVGLFVKYPMLPTNPAQPTSSAVCPIGPTRIQGTLECPDRVSHMRKGGSEPFSPMALSPCAPQMTRNT
jgi:hypothetical protein